MNRRIRGKINSGEVGALYDNERKNKTIIKPSKEAKNDNKVANANKRLFLIDIRE